MNVLSHNSLFIAQVSVEPVFGWYAVVPLALLLLASLWLTLTSSGLSWNARILLGLVRLAAMSVLLIGWLRPAVISERENESAGAIAVLMDKSQSMTLASGSSDQSRWQVQQEIWKAIESATKLEIGKTQLVPYFYDREPTAAAGDDLPSLAQFFAKAPVGRATEIGGTLAKIGRMQLDPPLRGVIMIGDGTQTVIPAAVDATVAARQMAQLDQPILFVGVGPRGEKSQYKDVAIEGLPEHFNAFIKKELKVPLVVNIQGMQGVPVAVTLTLKASGKPDRVVAERQVTASNPSEKMALDLTVLVPDEGEYLLEANARVEATEQNKTNNQVTSFVTVREGGVRILYLSGQPLPEQKFLRRSLEESRDFATEYLSWPERERRKWPLDLPGDLRQIDALIIDELVAEALSKSASDAILARVRRGAGILFMGGYRSFDAGGYGNSPLAPMFPVVMERKARPWGGPIDASLQIKEDVLLRPSRPHPITNFAPEPDNTRIWRQLQPLKGMNRFGQLQRTAGVQVLLEGPNREPALVAGEFGDGRVLAFAGDSTWQWCLAGQTKRHQQFWRQALLWLIRRDTLNEGFRLVLDRRRLLLDETPTMTVEWFGGSDNKAMPAELTIELTRDGRMLQSLSTSPTSESVRKTTIAGLDTPGLYRAALTAKADDGKVYQAETAFVVRDESRELSQAAADWQMINNIVSANRSAGGQLIYPNEIGTAIEWLRKRQDSTKVTTVEKRRLGDAAWDAWLYLVLFCLLMSIEWGLRKSWQLP